MADLSTASNSALSDIINGSFSGGGGGNITGFHMGNAAEDMDLYCGDMDSHFAAEWMKCQYWCEGIFFSIVGAIGLLGNLISIFILMTK